MTEPTTMIQELKTRILNGGMISREEALALYEAPLEELCSAARQIQLHFCQDRFDLCTIINGKSGRCRKTADSAPSPPFILPAQRNILCWTLRPSSGKPEGTTSRASCVFPL